jgi:hypothetical protein
VPTRALRRILSLVKLTQRGFKVGRVYYMQVLRTLVTCNGRSERFLCDTMVNCVGRSMVARVQIARAEVRITWDRQFGMRADELDPSCFSLFRDLSRCKDVLGRSDIRVVAQHVLLPVGDDVRGFTSRA